jgi:hypothetical protein
MTAIKATAESVTVLDFSKSKCSKNQIKRAIRQCEFIHSKKCEGNKVTVYSHFIKVGMYSILVYLPYDSSANCNRLRQYGDFEVHIWDGLDTKLRSLNLERDSRFNNQYWVPKNTFGRLRITHLVDIIAYCHRLDRLKCFL